MHSIRNLWHRFLVRVHPTRCHLLTATVEDGDSVRTIYRAITEEQATLLIESAMEAGLPGWAELDDGNLMPINPPWEEDEDDGELDLDLTEEERQMLMEELKALGYDEDLEAEDDDDEFGLFGDDE